MEGIKEAIEYVVGLSQPNYAEHEGKPFYDGLISYSMKAKNGRTSQCIAFIMNYQRRTRYKCARWTV